MKISGIYQIVNLTNNKRYIGSSNDIRVRFNCHKHSLRHGTNLKNPHLYRSYQKYGEDAFSFEIIERCEIALLEEREQYYIDKYDFNTLYNIRPLALNNAGIKFSAEACRNMSLARIGNTNRKGKPSKNINPLKGVKKNKAAWNRGLIMNYSKPAGVQNEFAIVSPGGILYRGISLKSFCNIMGFNTGMFNIIKGKYKQHKGWTLPKENVIYPDVITYQHFPKPYFGLTVLN